MNNMGRLGAQSNIAITGMFDIPSVFRCPVEDTYVRQWCNENTDILCFVKKVPYSMANEKIARLGPFAWP